MVLYAESVFGLPISCPPFNIVQQYCTVCIGNVLALMGFDDTLLWLMYVWHFLVEWSVVDNLCAQFLTGLSMGYCVIVALTVLPIGYYVLVITLYPIGRPV